MTTGDFDGDGLQDLVTANSGSNNVSVLLRGVTFSPEEPVTFFPANETGVLQVQDATVVFTENPVFTATVSTSTSGSGGAAGGGLPVLDEVVVEAVTLDVTSQDELLVLPESRSADVAKFDIADFEPPDEPVDGKLEAASDPEPVLDPFEEPQSTIGESAESSGKSRGLMAGVIGTASATLLLLLEIARRRWKNRSAEEDRSMKSFAEMAKDQEKQNV